jgi:hypothetical protein
MGFLGDQVVVRGFLGLLVQTTGSLIWRGGMNGAAAIGFPGSAIIISASAGRRVRALAPDLVGRFI